MKTTILGRCALLGTMASLAAMAVMPVSAALSASPADTALLARSYLGFVLSQQVDRQVGILADDARPEDRDEILAAAQTWSAGRMNAIRASLEESLGDQARPMFEEFVGTFTAAERNLDAEILQEVSIALKLYPMPEDYAALKRVSLESVMTDEVRLASAWLSEVQTWMDLRRRGEDVPPLAIWLERGTPTAAPAVAEEPAPTRRAAPAQPVRRAGGALADAEAEGFDQFEVGAEDEESPLDTFGSMRSKRREKAMQEAEAGMKQVADERRAAEEEYAAKKLASAQAEADAMKRQAEKLAAVEGEALEQRKNSWGNRLKSIVGATVGAATGAFTGGIGTRAGQEAANALFKSN